MRVCVFMQRILLQRPLDGAIQLWSQWAKFDSCSRIGSSQWWTRFRRLWCPILKRIIILNWFFSVICSNRFAKCGTHSAGTVRWVTKWELLTLCFVKELKFHIMGAKWVVCWTNIIPHCWFSQLTGWTRGNFSNVSYKISDTWQWISMKRIEVCAVNNVTFIWLLVFGWSTFSNFWTFNKFTDSLARLPMTILVLEQFTVFTDQWMHVNFI